MRRSWQRVGLSVVLGGGFLLGCQQAAPRPSYPADPLLADRHPIEGKPDQARSALICSEPAVPPLPPAAVISAPRIVSASFKTSVTDRSSSRVNRPEENLPAPDSQQPSTVPIPTRRQD